MTKKDVGVVKAVAVGRFCKYGGYHDVDDLVQEGCIGWLQAEKNRPNQPIGYYMKAARFSMIDYLRKEYGRYGRKVTKIRQATHYSIEGLIEAGNLGEANRGFFELMKAIAQEDSNYEKVEIANLLAILPPIKRAILELSYFLGWEEKEIAKLWGISPTTVNRHKMNVRKQLLATIIKGRMVKKRTAKDSDMGSVTKLAAFFHKSCDKNWAKKQLELGVVGVLHKNDKSRYEALHDAVNRILFQLGEDDFKSGAQFAKYLGINYNTLSTKKRKLKGKPH